MQHPKGDPRYRHPDPGGATTAAPIDSVLQFAKVVSSSLAGDTQALQYNVAGIAGMSLTLEPNGQGGRAAILSDDDAGETNARADVYGSLGVVARPLPPDTRDGREEHLEVWCIRGQDGLVPVATRDLRLRMAGGDAPGEGVVAVVGYGGGFHSLTPVEDDSGADGGGTIHVLYCPYEFDAAGDATKAHSVILDPTPGNESITIAHADGMAITMLADEKKALVLKNAAGDATIRLDDDGITMTAVQIVLSGGVVIGEPSLASPLLPGVASQGSTKLYVSP